MESVRNPRLQLIILLTMLLMIGSLTFIGEQQRAVAQETYPSITEYHPYTSSVDGATLPCTIYKPSRSAIVAAGGDPSRIPLWVDLKAFGGHGDFASGTYDFSNAFVLSPWGRNFKGMYADSREIEDPEPCIFDDYARESDGPATGWIVESGSWINSGYYDSYYQGASDDNYHIASRENSSGEEYTITVDVVEELIGGDNYSGMGICFRRQANGDCYALCLVDFSDPNQGPTTGRGKGKLLTLYR